MNRRSFFRSLAIGAASAPALVKVLAEEPMPKIMFVRDNPANPHLDAYCIQMDRMMKEIIRRVAETNPYSQLLQSGGLTKEEIRQLST